MAGAGEVGGVTVLSQSPLAATEEVRCYQSRVEVVEGALPEEGEEEATKGDQETMIPILTSSCRDSRPSEASLCPSAAGRRSD